MEEKPMVGIDPGYADSAVLVVGADENVGKAVAEKLPDAKVVHVQTADREVTLPMPEPGQTVTEPPAATPPPKPETLADNPGKWAKANCPHCFGAGIAGRIVTPGQKTEPVYCACARKAWKAHLEAMKKAAPERQLAEALAQERAREAAIDRIFTLQDRAREEIDAVRKLEQRLVVLGEPWPEECGLKPLAEHKATLEACRAAVETQIGQLQGSTSRCREAIEAENANIANARIRISTLEREIGQLETEIARRQRDDLGTISKQMLVLEGKIKVGEETREREQRRIRRKIREAQDRYDKFMDRAAKIRRETGIEVQHAETGLGSTGTPGDGAGPGVDSGTPDGKAPAGGAGDAANGSVGEAPGQ